MASIQFLGTGPDVPITDRRSKDHRLNTSTEILHADTGVLIDVGPSWHKQVKLLRKPPERYNILLSHGHNDAIGGLPRFLKEYPATVYLTHGLEKQVSPKLPKGTRVYGLAPFHRRQIGDVVVTPFLVEHAKDTMTFGYGIEVGVNRVVYASDFLRLPLAAQRFFHKADLAIVDGAGWDRPVFGHQAVLAFLDLVKQNRWDLKRVRFTQIGRAVPTYEVANRTIREKRPRAALAYDGEVLPLA